MNIMDNKVTKIYYIIEHSMWSSELASDDGHDIAEKLIRLSKDDASSFWEIYVKQIDLLITYINCFLNIDHRWIVFIRFHSFLK